MIRKNEVFQRALQTQFALRHNNADAAAQKMAEKQSEIHVPRYCYKFNRCQKQIYTDQEESQTLYQNLSGNKYQSISPMQTYPNFAIHLADCLLNPVSD